MIADNNSRIDRIKHVLLNIGPWPFLLLGVIDRAFLIGLFGGEYVTTDDAIMWAGAVDYAHGIFRLPYYYGQDYGPMLEALVAAPLVRSGVPLRWAMPVVSSFLALLPYWSFALWNHKHGRAWAALVFALTPLLLPLEFGMITTIPRGFVTGLAPLAFLPWIYGLTNTWIRSLFTGCIIAVAWAINPNSLIFSCAYIIWYVLNSTKALKTVVTVLIGAFPSIYLHHLAQVWCTAHSEAIIHRLSVDNWHFDAATTLNNLGHLRDHFQWLCPIAWRYSEMIGIGVIALCITAYLKAQRPLAIALTLTVLAIIASFSLPKVHDGWDSIFYPLSRMFLALPLLFAWGVSVLLRRIRVSGTFTILSILITATVVGYKTSNIRATAKAQLQLRPNGTPFNHTTSY